MLLPLPKPIITAVILVSMAHLVLLMIPVVFEQNKSSRKTTTLKLTLKSPVPDTPRVDLASQPVLDNKRLKQESAALPEPISNELESTELDETDKASNPTSTLNRNLIIESVVTTLRQQDEQPMPRGFSLEQWLPQPEPQYARPSMVPQLLASNAVNRSSTSSAGQATDLVRGPNGKTACWQQRGIPGEPQQWYRVPLTLCGHLDSD